jgi:hypothetical protein
MSTGNYDVVTEINERFMNRVLAMIFYTSVLKKIEGSYLPKEVPASMSFYGNVRYNVKIKEPPTVDAFSGNLVRILINSEAVLKVLGGLNLELDAIASLETSPTYDQNGRSLTLDIKKGLIDDIEIDEKYDIPDDTLKFVNNAMTAAITAGLVDSLEKIPITPPLYQISDLPDMPPGVVLPVNLGGVRILNPRVLALAINFLDYNGGNISQVTDFSRNLDIAVGMTEAGMHRVFDFWWEKTTHPKSVTRTGSADLGLATDILNVMSDICEVAAFISTAGVVEDDYTVEKVWVEYGATVRFSKPAFNLLNGNQIEITNCSLPIHVWASPKMKVKVKVAIDTSGAIPDSWTPWDDDITISEKEYTVSLKNPLSCDITVNVNKAKARVYLDNNSLMAKIEDLNATISLPITLPEVALNTIITWIEKIIVDHMPPIRLSPVLISKTIPAMQKTIPGTSITIETQPLNLDIQLGELVTTDTEAIAGANVSIRDIPIKISPVPAFIVNADPKKKEIHRAGCTNLENVLEKDKLGYYTIMDALNAGYHGCSKCIPEYK